MVVLEKRLIDPTTVEPLYPWGVFGALYVGLFSICTSLTFCLWDIWWLGDLEPLYL
tara:strand:+ start:142 stop:309 length:168 start_codon:yes stop_codon:yes gene_type:complete